MKKLILLSICFLLCACSTNTYTKEEEKLIAKADQIMKYLQDEEYDKIAKEFSILTGNPRDDIGSIIQQGWESIPAEYGEFLGVDRYVIIHLKSGSEVKIIANYEHYKAQFTINFLSNGKVAGFFLK